MTTDTTSEMEMRELYNSAISALSTLRDRTLSAVIAHTTQAKELVELRERFDSLNQRMDAVVNEAQRNRQDLHVVMAERDKYKKDAEEALSMAQGYERDWHETRDELNTVRASRAQAEADLLETQRKLEASNKSVVDLGQDLTYLRQNLASLRTLHSDEVDRNTALKKELEAANTRLNKLQGVMRELFPEPKVEPQPVTAPNPVAEQSHEDKPLDDGEVRSINERIDQSNETPKQDDQEWWKKNPF